MGSKPGIRRGRGGVIPGSGKTISIHVYGADIERLGSSVYRIYDELALAG
jgi:hypothetical protein